MGLCLEDVGMHYGQIATSEWYVLRLTYTYIHIHNMIRCIKRFAAYND